MIIGDYWWQPECFSRMLANVFFIGGQLLLLWGCGWINWPVCCFGSKLLQNRGLVVVYIKDVHHQQLSFPALGNEKVLKATTKVLPNALAPCHTEGLWWWTCLMFTTTIFLSHGHVAKEMLSLTLAASTMHWFLQGLYETVWPTCVQVVWKTFSSVVWLKGLTVRLIWWPSN